MASKPMKVQNRIKKSSANSQWFQNVARSMGFTAADIVKDLMPNTSDFLEYNTADTMSMITDMRTNTSSRQMVSRQFKNIPQIKSVNQALKNMQDDIMSGNFNNKSREKEFDFDDMDFGVGAFGDENGLEFIEEETGKPSSQPTVINTLPLAKMINAGTEATVTTMVSVAEQQMAIESEKLLFNHKSTKSILGGLSAINDNLSTLVKFNAESTAKYHAASIKFYEESLEMMKKQTQTSNVEEMNGDTSSLGGLYSYTGGIKFDEYKKILQDNIRAIKDENAMVAGAMDSLLDPQVLKRMAKNPVGTLATIGMKSIIPVAAKASLKAIDESISTIIPAMMAKVNTLDGNDNPIYDYIYKVFGTKNKLEYSVDLGKYEKGAMSWDGECKKALTEVLPAHLRRIEAALTGQEERMYNYSTGRFTGAKSLKKDYDKAMKEKETSGYSDTKSRMRLLASGMNANKATMEQFEKDMDEYFSAMTKKGSLINPFVSVDKDGNKFDEFAALSLFSGDAKRAQMMRNVMKGLNMKELSKMATMQIYDSRKETQKYLDEIRKNPTMSGHANLFNGSYYNEDGKVSYDASKKGGSRDKFGLSSLDYLRDIRQALLTGVRVFPDTSNRYKGWEPNKGLIKKQYNENKSYRMAQEAARKATKAGQAYNYEDVLGMSDLDLEKLYGTHDDGRGASTLASLVNAQVYKVLFGNVTPKTGKQAGNMMGAATTAGKGGMGSIFNNTVSFFSDTLKGVGAYFTGQPYTMSDGTRVEANNDSILGKMKSFFTGTMDSLTGGNDGEGKQGGLIGRVSKDFMEGFQQFKISLFGERKVGDRNNAETLKELTSKIKPMLPKAIGYGVGTAVVKTALASKMGLLGSILLPGGPLGAALIGTTAGFLKQSETFNNWLFGEKNQEGQRMGGFLPKSLVSTIESHGGVIKKGAVVGGAVGMLPSFFLPGGPITGAVMGMSAGLMSKSDVFQEFLYGKDFREKDAKSMMNGAFGKLYKNTIGKAAGEDTNPKLAAFLGSSGIGVGIAQGVGLLPSFLLPGGPVLGAMLGLAGGITASSDKFQQFLFGDKDVDGKRYGGLMTKFSNWFDTSVMSPLKIKMTEVNDKLYGFMQEKLFNPFMDAFEPIKQAGLFMMEDIKNSFKKITDPVVDSFRDNVTKPLGEQMKKYIVDPIAKKVNSLFSLLGKTLGAIVASPMKLLSFLGNRADRYNEKRVIRDERKRRRDEARENSPGGLGGLLSSMRSQFIFGEERENLLNEKLGYREGRNARKNGRDEKLAEEMEARAQKRADMQKQYEEDMKFGKGTGWKFASKKQQAAREKELKDKQAWMQEKVAAEVTETNNKIGKITSILEKGTDLTDETVQSLKEIKKLLKDNLKSLGEKTGMSEVANKLRNMGQSHKDGLDKVPEDGYLAELHEGEMVVPKKPAGFLRGLIGGKKKSSLGEMFGKLLGNDKADRADNALGLTESEESQLSELEDRERYDKVSRKSVDFLQAGFARRKKEKEEKKWKDEILTAVHSVGKTVGKGNDIVSGLFSGIMDFFKGLPKLLSGLLGALGLGGLGALAAGGLGMTALNEYSNIAEDYGASTADVIAGYGREERLDADGMYVYDNQGSSVLGKFAHKGTRKAFAKPFIVGYDKFGKPLMEQGKTTYKNAKSIAQKGAGVAKKGMTAVDNYINPKVAASGKSFLGTSYSFTGSAIDKSARKGIAKPVGAVVDAAKVATKRTGSAMSTFIDMARSAMLLVEQKAVKKFPKLGSVAKSVDGIFQSILKNSDEVYRKFGPKISTFIADTALDVTPVGAALEVCATAYDFISGFTKGNTGNLFGVPENQVDMEMRNITSFMQTLCGFSFMAIIWIINEITSSMMGFDFMQTIARTIYKALPINFGRKIDLSDDLRGKNIDGMTLEDAIAQAGGDVSQFKDKKGNWLDITKLNNDNLSGISAPEIMELQRLQYNQQNGTKLDSLAWKDKQSKTLGQKILGNSWVKNFKGSFQSQSIRGHMGLNTDAKLTMGDRAKYLFGSTGVNMANALGKITGNKALKDITTEKLFQGYEEKRTSKYQGKVDKANEKINKLMDKNENTDNGLVKAWNNMLMGIQKGKRSRARKKLGTTRKKSQRQEQLDAMKNKKTKALVNPSTGYKNKNAADENLQDINMREYEAYGMAAAKGGVAMGKGDDTTAPTKKVVKKKAINKSGKKSVDKAENTLTDAAKSVDSMFSKLNRSVKKSGTTLSKGLEKGNKTVSKSFTDINKSLSKVAKSTKRSMDKESKSATKELKKDSSKLTKSVRNVLTAINKKVSEAVKDIKNIKIKTANTVTPSFSVEDPKKFLESIFSKININKKDNAGSSGAKATDNVKPVKHTISKADYVSPSTTNNNNNTNNKFVFYNQGDNRWGGMNIGDSNLKDAGCGPTSLAMAVSQMTGEQITPDTIAKLGKEHLPGYSTYSLFPSIADKLNMNYTEGNDSRFIVDNIKRGVPVILSGKGNGTDSPYTSEGHIVTASDVKGDKVFVQDPRGKEYSKYYPIQSLLQGLNKSMALSPSSRTSKLPSSGKLQGWNNTLDRKVSKNPLGIYGDIGSLENDNMSLGKTGGGKVRVVDKVLSYMRAFLNQKSKFRYTQANRDEINRNGSGADCSSFVGHVLTVAGDTPVSGTSQTMWDSTGTKVDNPQVGDIVCQQGHVGLYSGDGKYIHMSSPKSGIKESDVMSKYNNPHRGYKRVLKNPSAMVDAVISGGNSLLGTVTATSSGTPVEGGASAEGANGAPAEEVNPLGVFGKFGNIGQNMMASIFNGKQVDLFSSSPGEATTGSSTDISNMSDTKQAVWKFFTSAGYSKEATAGIMGNMQQESGINPKAIQGNGRGPAAGIAQWENYNKKSARWKQLSDYAQSKGKDWTDLQTQLEFVNMELSGSTGTDKYTSSLLNKKVGSIEGFKSLNDIGKATEVFENSFERAGVKVMDKRKKFAQDIYDQMTTSLGKGPAMASNAESAPGDGSIPTSMNGWAYYQQTDPKWNNGKIDGTTVGTAGCGPTSHAMMLTSLFGQQITPDVMTQWAHKNGTWFNGGMYHTMPGKVASEFGLSMPKTWSGKSASTLADIKATIKAGHPVIMSGRGKSGDTNTPFTTGGHIVLGVGVDGNDNIIINDARGPKYTKAYSDAGLTNYGTGLRAAWAFKDTSTKKIPDGITTGGAWTGGAPGSAAASGGSVEQTDPLGVFGKLGNIGQNMMASIFNGKQVDLFATNSDGDTTGASASGTGTFPKYNLNDQQIKGLANIIQHEQPGPEGMQAEASLMANLVDIKGDEHATVDNLIKKATGGWFAYGKSRFNNPGNPSSTAINAVKNVLVNGRRTIPRYVNEHDMFGDITSVTNNGSGITKTNRGQYKPFVTKIKNRYGASGTFHSFPNSKSDPFYYTSEEMRQKWGENHYQPDTSAGMGDGKTHWVKGFGDNKPKKMSYTGSMGKGDSTTTQQYQSAKRVMEKTIRQIDRATIASGSSNNSSAMSQACMEVLGAIINELQAINSNTAATAKGVADIEIVSANEPVTGVKTGVGNLNSKNGNSQIRQSNSNTGYDVARQIASYK